MQFIRRLDSSSIRNFVYTMFVFFLFSFIFISIYFFFVEDNLLNHNCIKIVQQPLSRLLNPFMWFNKTNSKSEISLILSEKLCDLNNSWKGWFFWGFYCLLIKFDSFCFLEMKIELYTAFRFSLKRKLICFLLNGFY